MSPQKYSPPPGPTLPPPTNVQSIPSLLDLDAQLRSYPWYPRTTLAVQASLNRTRIYQYAHRADTDSLPLSTLFDTKFRLASVTKLFTVLAVLLSSEKIGWEDCIRKHVPELDEEAYKEVTVASLAGHTCGLGRFGYVSDLALLPSFSPSSLGLPSVRHSLPGCDVYPGGRICTPPEVLSMFDSPLYHPSTPHSFPLYSNISFTLLGLALSRTHGKSFTQVIQDLILAPLNLDKTSFSLPDKHEPAMFPAAEKNAWQALPFGNLDPAGGLWSTPTDTLSFLHALSSHALLPASQTRKWLAPASLLPSLYQALGAPWEIFRAADGKVQGGKPVDCYTKAGGVAGYASEVVLVPEYGIAMTVHAAGDEAVEGVKVAVPLLIDVLVGYANGLARQEARERYTGTYTTTSSSEGQSKVVISMDDGPGLRMEECIMNGIDVLPVLAGMRGLEPEKAVARIYPADEDTGRGGKQVWRMMIDKEREGEERGFAERECASWNWGDAVRYAGVGLDRVVFQAEGGKAGSMEMCGWRATLSRVE